MPAEQPNPHGETLDTLRGVPAQLQTAVTAHPHDPTILPTVAALAEMERNPSPKTPSGSPANDDRPPPSGT